MHQLPSSKLGWLWVYGALTLHSRPEQPLQAEHLQTVAQTAGLPFLSWPGLVWLAANLLMLDTGEPARSLLLLLLLLIGSWLPAHRCCLTDAVCCDRGPAASLSLRVCRPPAARQYRVSSLRSDRAR